MAKQRVVPDREPTGAELWWYGSDESLPKTQVTPSRAARAGKKLKPKKERPTWTVVIMVVAVVLFVGGLFIAYLDISRGRLVSIWSDTPTTTVARIRGGYEAMSVDTVADKVRAKDHEVDYLEAVYAPLAYDAADTTIDGQDAKILVFKDRATAERWVERHEGPTVNHNTWAIAVEGVDLAGKLALDLDADMKEE